MAATSGQATAQVRITAQHPAHAGQRWNVSEVQVVTVHAPGSAAVSGWFKLRVSDGHSTFTTAAMSADAPPMQDSTVSSCTSSATFLPSGGASVQEYLQAAPFISSVHVERRPSHGSSTGRPLYEWVVSFVGVGGELKPMEVVDAELSGGAKVIVRKAAPGMGFRLKAEITGASGHAEAYSAPFSVV